MAQKHTPGPWATTTRQGSWDWLVYSLADPNIEICQPFHDGTEFNEVGEANARLIAAAPELLAEAIELLRNAEYADGVATVLTQDCEALKAAIAKAEGGAS